MTDRVTDIWFRSDLPLREIAARLGLSDVTYDAENHWEWVIGERSGVSIDITRTHTKPAGETDTRLFLLGRASFSKELLDEIVSGLRTFVPGPIAHGSWWSRPADEVEPDTTLPVNQGEEPPP